MANQESEAQKKFRASYKKLGIKFHEGEGNQAFEFIHPMGRATRELSNDKTRDTATHGSHEQPAKLAKGKDSN
jgi:hypothetical protein